MTYINKKSSGKSRDGYSSAPRSGGKRGTTGGFAKESFGKSEYRGRSKGPGQYTKNDSDGRNRDSYDPYVMRGASARPVRKNGDFKNDKPYRQSRPIQKPAFRKPEIKTPAPEEAVDEMLLVGKNAVWEALKAGRSIERLYLAQGIDETTVSGILGISNREKIKVERVPKVRITEIAGTEKHQGIVAYLSATEYVSLDEMMDKAFEETDKPVFILLDEVQDPHNLGAVIRTADCAGANGVIVLEHRSVGLTATVAKVSAGALSHIPVARVTNLVRAMEQLQERGVILYGAAMEGKSCYECDFTDNPIGIVIGNEGVGLRRLVKEQCDVLTGIPIYGHVDSLNASVAAAVLMFEAVRQRKSID